MDAILNRTSGFAGERQKGRRKEWEHIMQKKTGILIVVAGVLLFLYDEPDEHFSDVQFGFSFKTKN